jgi:K(+)-stimulated pyrophosphate-energized sodium pump
MNLVALLIAPSVVKYGVGDHKNLGVRAVVAVIAIGIIVAAVTVSNRRGVAGSAEVIEKVGAGV